MSYDHKPEDEVELARIKNAGGKVTMDGRVNGGLNLSRAIGKEYLNTVWLSDYYHQHCCLLQQILFKNEIKIGGSF